MILLKTFFLRLRWRIVFFFDERLKKFQKRDKVSLCKRFASIDQPYTLDFKKTLLTILITSYTAYQIIFALQTPSFSKLLPFLDYKKVMLITLSITYIACEIPLVWLTRNFHLGRISFSRNILTRKQKVARG